jgi:biopolymer transport protein ExbD
MIFYYIMDSALEIDPYISRPQTGPIVGVLMIVAVIMLVAGWPRPMHKISIDIQGWRDRPVAARNEHEVFLGADDSVWVDGKSVTLNTVVETLRTETGCKHPTMVFLTIHPETKHEGFLKVLRATKFGKAQLTGIVERASPFLPQRVAGNGCAKLPSHYVMSSKRVPFFLAE